MSFECRLTHELREQRHALSGFHASQPDKGEPAGIQRAVFRRYSNPHDFFVFKPEQNHKQLWSLELHRAAFSGSAARETIFFFEPAGSAAGIAVTVVPATHGVIARDFWDAVSHPLRLVRLRFDAAERVRERSTYRARLNF